MSKRKEEQQMEPEKKHTIYGISKHGRREQNLEAAGIEPWDPNLAGGVENAEALEDIIGDGIADAEHSRTDIDLSTARAIARVLANAIGDAPALDHFAATGDGDRLIIEEEFLNLHENPTTPDIVRIWIDWLASFLFWSHHPEHPRPIAYPAHANELSRLLVRDRVDIGGVEVEMYRPASQSREDQALMAERTAELLAARGDLARAFLSLPDVDASLPNIAGLLDDLYIGVFDDIDEVLANITEYPDWEVELEKWAEQRGLIGMVALDRDEIEKMTRETWDIVELEGRCYVFNR
jgi:hypothetical protein